MSELAAMVVLLGLADLGPARLRWLVEGRGAQAALDGLVAGVVPGGPSPRGMKSDTAAKWFAQARSTDPDAVFDAHRRAGITIIAAGDETWPFEQDPEPPGLLFVQGDPSVLGRRPSVAIVGTRRCTSIGARAARELGHQLAAADVNVVSGLALGIDGESHRGWLSGSASSGASPVAVVSSGLDTVYPKRHRTLWSEVAAAGAVVSEWPLGVSPSRWRFPARNRIIAALADVVVVVESHRAGGALSTADEALSRDIPVAVMPGSVLSPASEGTNQLLVDGAIPVRNADDVLMMLSLSGSRPSATVAERSPEQTSQATLFASPIVEHLAAGSCTLDELSAATAIPVAELMGQVQELVLAGQVQVDGSRVMICGQQC